MSAKWISLIVIIAVFGLGGWRMYRDYKKENGS